MDDAVSRYCAATEAGDMDAMAATFSPDVELPSPLFRRLTFEGGDVRGILAAVYSLLQGLGWDAPIGEGRMRTAIARATVLGVRIDDAMVFELDQDGRIHRIRPHLRPLFATLVFFFALGPRVARNPLMLLRALRGS
ncbi:MAG: nuclear transport factor 2 family protein [Solirubrobacteraceae bacterium]